MRADEAKTVLNPGFGRLKPPLSPGVRGAGVSIDVLSICSSHLYILGPIIFILFF